MSPVRVLVHSGLRQLMAQIPATVRLQVGDGWHSLSGLVTVLAAPLLTTFIVVPDPGVNALLHAFQLLVVVFLGLHLRGRAIGPGGDSVPMEPLPTLPVRRWVRVAAIVIVGEVLLLAGTVLMSLLAFACCHDASATNPFRGAGLPPAALAQALLPLALTWAPLLASGGLGGGGILLNRGILYLAGLLGLAWLRVDQEPIRAALWCAVGLPLLTRLPATATGEATQVGSPAWQGKIGVFAWLFLTTTALAVAMGLGVGAISRAVGLPLPDSVLVGAWSATVLAAMLPVLPGVFSAGTLRPVGPEALSWLPVSRNHAVLGILGAVLTRTLIVSAIGSGALLVSNGEPVLFRPVAVFSAAFCLCTSLQLAGLPRSQGVALPGVLLGMMALGGGVRLRSGLPEWLTMGVPLVAIAFGLALTLRACRRGTFAI